MIKARDADAKLIDIMKNVSFSKAQELPNSLNSITQEISKFLNVGRVGIWTYTQEQDGIICASLYDINSNEFSKDITLLKKDYPDYFKAIEQDRIIEAYDARTHSATACFKEVYLEPLGIFSLYDTPIWRADKVIGVICLEYTELKSSLNITEKNFITSCADYIGKIYEKYAFLELIETLETKVNERTSELNKALTDLKNAQNTIISKEKLASLGALTAGIAHEIRNPLNLISNAASFLNTIFEAGANYEGEEKKQDIKTTVEIINKATKRAELIIKSMLNQSRNDNDFIQNDFNKSIRDSIELVEKSINFKIDTNLNLCELDPFIFSKISIERVIINILENSYYSLIRKKNKDSAFVPKISIESILLNQNSIQLLIRDNGEGMEKDQMKKLMIPFFTTKPTGEGTGLGLSMAFDIISSHNGKIDFKSEEGKYFETRICLPIKK